MGDAFATGFGEVVEMPSANCFHILTGEYPPQLGGVSDYTGHLAEALASCGKEVHIWTIPWSEATIPPKGITVHRIASNWSSADLQQLDQALDRFPSPRLLLIQYVFNSWGYKGLNLGFVRWILNRRSKGDDVQLMIHEPFYQWRRGDKLRRWVLSAIQQRMIRSLVGACTKVYVAIPAWETALRPYQPIGQAPMTWLPIPSNIPIVRNQAALEALRAGLALEGKKVIGTFSIHAEGVELAKILPGLLLAYSDRVGLLFGLNSESFAAALTSTYPQLKNRLVAKGILPREQISLYLQICDVMVQPYPDGVSSRRTSAMAGLSHGKPIVTYSGVATEPFWLETKCVALGEPDNLRSIAQLTELLLKNEEKRRQVEARATQTYNEYFEWDKILTKLLGPSGNGQIFSPGHKQGYQIS